MERRDLLKEQAEQLGKMLALLLNRLLSLRQQEVTEAALQATHQQFASDLHLDIAELVQLPPEEVPDYLDERLFQVEHLDQLVNYLCTAGDLYDELGQLQHQQRYLRTALTVNELADHRSDTYSFARQDQRARIERALQGGPAGP